MIIYLFLLNCQIGVLCLQTTSDVYDCVVWLVLQQAAAEAPVEVKSDAADPSSSSDTASVNSQDSEDSDDDDEAEESVSKKP